MSERDDLFQQFGPYLTEAFMLLIWEEVNRIRSHVGMPAITKQDVLDQINNHLSGIEPYDWMTEENP